ncbi:MAG: hypothetical protein AB8B51_12985 [Sedimentitalea sp.]
MRRAALALALTGCATAPFACPSEPGLSPLADYDSAMVRDHISTTLIETARYFQADFTIICVSRPLNLAQANVLTGELRLGWRFLQRYGARSDLLTITAMLAHETAHLFQYQTDWFDQTPGKATTVRCVELYADFLAGGFLVWHLEQSGQTLRSPRDLLYGLVGQSGFLPLMVSQHGLPEERDRAFESGFAMSSELSAPQMATGWASLAATLGCVD